MRDKSNIYDHSFQVNYFVIPVCITAFYLPIIATEDKMILLKPSKVVKFCPKLFKIVEYDEPSDSRVYQ